MKAMVLVEPDKIEPQEIDTPKPKDGEVLIRISHMGICGTDTKIFSGAIPSAMPVIMGHEIVGEIAEGPNAGQRILVLPRALAACLEGGRDQIEGGTNRG